MYKISRQIFAPKNLRKIIAKYNSSSKVKKPESSKKSLKNKQKSKSLFPLSTTHVVMENYNVNSINKSSVSKSCDVYSEYRHWEPTTCYTNLKKETGTEFTVVSYNILAQDLLEEHSHNYQSHQKNALDWSYRLSKLTDELHSLKPHIICLQEVQNDHLDSIQCSLKDLNLKYIYKKKTGSRTDGCAIFYSEDKFTIKDFKSVEFYQPDIEKLDRQNVGLIARLFTKDYPEELLVIATTHLLYNPRRQDVRLAQIQVLLAELDHLSFKGFYNDGIPERFPIILTGDFNLKPFSAPYKLITSGELEYSNLTRLTLEEPYGENVSLVGKQFLPPHLGITDNCQHIDVVVHSYTKQSRLQNKDAEKMHKISLDLVESCSHLFSSGRLTHGLNLKSTYCHFNKLNENYASTYQDGWITVDYIFYNYELEARREVSLKLLSRYVLPTVAQCLKMGMIPNHKLGSDHLVLAVQFLLKTEKKKMKS